MGRRDAVCAVERDRVGTGDVQDSVGQQSRGEGIYMVVMVQDSMVLCSQGPHGAEVL